MKTILALATLVLISASCAPTQPGGPAAASPGRVQIAQEGSLANAKLIRDTTAALRKIEGGNAPIIKFVVKQPTGPIGKKAWNEVWIYDPQGRKENFMVAFQENGHGSADFKISKK